MIDEQTGSARSEAVKPFLVAPAFPAVQKHSYAPIRPACSKPPP